MEYIRILCEKNKFDVNAKSEGSEDELDNFRSKWERISLFRGECLLLSEVLTSVSRSRARTRGLFPRVLYKT